MNSENGDLGDFGSDSDTDHTARDKKRAAHVLSEMKRRSLTTFL